MAEWHKPKKTGVKMALVPQNHQEAAHKYYSDVNLRVWRAEPASRTWVEIRAPRWEPWNTYFVGYEAPPPMTLKESRTKFFITDKRSLGVDARKYRLLLSEIFAVKGEKGKESSELAKKIRAAKTFQEIDDLLEAEATFKSEKYKPKAGISLGMV